MVLSDKYNQSQFSSNLPDINAKAVGHAGLFYLLATD
jgi:hypothetical protein